MLLHYCNESNQNGAQALFPVDYSSSDIDVTNPYRGSSTIRSKAGQRNATVAVVCGNSIRPECSTRRCKHARCQGNTVSHFNEPTCQRAPLPWTVTRCHPFGRPSWSHESCRGLHIVQTCSLTQFEFSAFCKASELNKATRCIGDNSRRTALSEGEISQIFEGKKPVNFLRAGGSRLMREDHRSDVSVLRTRLSRGECGKPAGPLEDREALAVQDIVPGRFAHRALDHVTGAIQHKFQDNCARFSVGGRRISF